MSAARRPGAAGAVGDAPVIGRLSLDDRIALAALIEATGQFRPSELAVALEVFDEAFAPGGGGGVDPGIYAWLAARDATRELIGVACWGRTPHTRGTCDLYWLAVAPTQQGRGIGHQLVEAAEAAMRVDGARLSVVEASGRLESAKVRRFHERQGYERSAVVTDFYAADDDRVTYIHRLRQN